LSGGRASAPDHNWALTTRSLHLQLQRIFQRSSLRCFEVPAPSSGSIPRASVPTRLVALVFARDDRERACCPSGPPGVATSLAVMHGPVPPALVSADPPSRGGQGSKPLSRTDNASANGRYARVCMPVSPASHPEMRENNGCS